MARNEQDREDLMGEATALVRRVELQLAGFDAPWVIGFRRGGEASVFVGADPVFQFNRSNELRRGYWNGDLVKAECGRLVQLERRRTASESHLVRSDLDACQANEFLELAAGRLLHLQQALVGDKATIISRVPHDFDVQDELLGWLESLPQPLAIAAAPNVSA